MWSALAQAGTRSLSGVYVWSGVVVALTLVAFAGYSALRRWMQSSPTDAGPPRGFTLADLRDLHRQGKMTDAEHDAARAQIVGAAKRVADALPPVLPRTPTRPKPPDAAGPS